VQRAAALLAVLSLVLAILVIVVTEMLRTPECVSYLGGACREWAPAPGAVVVAPFVIALGAVCALFGAEWGRRVALLVSVGGLLVCGAATLLLVWVDLRDDLLREAQTLTGLFLVATIVLWRRTLRWWGLLLVAAALLVIVVPYGGILLHLELLKSAPRASPVPMPNPSP
jgi:hypothetical protein